MAALTDEVKMFIVQCLACYDTPSQVAESVKEEFNIVVERQNIMRYDPTKISGRSLSQKLKDIFETTRKAFLEETLEIPIASKIFRLRALQRSHTYYVSKKNYIAANQVLEQAAKEVGGIYTNKLIHAGDSVNPLLMWLQQIGGTSIPIAQTLPDEDYIEGEVVEPAKPTKPKWSAPKDGGD